jgi:Carboxypeptidase regulatory-like domain
MKVNLVPRWMVRMICPLAASLVLNIAAQAQTSRGTVSGTVMDQSGAIVAGARTALTNNHTGVSLEAAANEAGIYRFDAVDLGTYELRINYPGFAVFRATGLSVEANRTTVMDVRLEVGGEATAVQVSAEAEALTIRDGPLRGGNFLPQQVSQLPLVDLNPFSLARTLAGVIRPSGSAVAGEGGGEGVLFSVNGQRVRGNNFLLDGTDNNDITFTGIAQPFNIADAVEEVSVQTSNKWMRW